MQRALDSLANLRTLARGPCAACGSSAGSPICAACCSASLVRSSAWLAPLDGLPLYFAGAYHGAAGSASLSPLGRTILAFKDHGNRYAGHCLVRLLAARAGQCLEEADALVAVPPDPVRLRGRGFSAAAWLAAGAARQHARPLLHGALRRTGNRPPQRGLGGIARRTNAHGVLALGRADVRGYAITIVDDVATTGATLRDAAATLTAAGARHVSGLVLACADEKLVQPCRSKTENDGMRATGAPRA